ncbi:hypothetical protein B566_EDAN009640 [Ephemera danica]|nr:hypothetical protein B566_EDAN009640 [Ephemera danica]
MSQSIIPKISRLSARTSALFLCDMQEKFRTSIQYFNEVVFNSSRLLLASRIFEMPVVCTEQYPKGLGRTVPELGIQEHGIVPVQKTRFSMCVPEVLENLKSKHSEVNTVVLCGIETHACIHETAMDLLEKGFGVHVVVDACSSRSLLDRQVYILSNIFVAIQENITITLVLENQVKKWNQMPIPILNRLSRAGASLNTCEGVILSLAKDSRHPKFREIQKIIWDVSPDTGLTNL